MAYESTMVSTTADPTALRQALADPEVVGCWPGFRALEGRERDATTWRTRQVASRSFPPGGLWRVEHHVLRDDDERPEIRLDCTAGRSAVSLTVEAWTLAPQVRLIRVGVRHGSAGRLRYAARKLRRASEDFGKQVAVLAGGEVLERVGIETVQRLGILGSSPDDGAGPVDDPLDEPREDDPSGGWR